MASVNFFLFGVTGNLAKIKILPALSRFPDLNVVGVGRRDFDFPNYIQKDVLEQGEEISSEIEKYEGEKIFYLATYPSVYPAIFKIIEKFKDAKVAIEKPIARDLKIPFPESQIYRVDHYLGKSGLRKLASESLKDVSEVRVYMLEDFGIEDRTGFYDNVGALNDVGQNHILQMIASAFSADSQEKRLNVIKSLVPDPASLVLGSFEGYGKTDTYFSFNAKHGDVLVSVCAGKNLNETKKEVEVIFKDGSKNVYKMDEVGKSAHEQLISEIMAGDRSYFNSDEEIKASWDFIEKVRGNNPKIVTYKIGSRPQEIN